MVFGDVVRQKVLSLVFFYILDFWKKVAGEKHLKIHNNDEN